MLTSKWPRLAGALVAVVLSLAIVNVTATQAEAFDAGGFLDVGESLTAGAAAEGGAEAVGAGVCVASVVCAGTVAAVGTLAYATRDTWMPWVKGILGGSSSSAVTSTTSGCVITPSSVTFDSDTSVTATLGYQGCIAGSSEVVLMYAAKISCQVTSTGAVVNPSTVQLGASPNGGGTTAGGSGSFSGSGQICPAGSKIVSFHLEGEFLYNDVIYLDMLYSNAIPTSALSNTTKVTCTNPDGSTVTISGTVTGTDEKVPMPSCAEEDPGSTPSKVAISSGLPGAENPVETVTLPSLKSQYPGCFDANGAFLSTCVVRIWINGSPCHVGMAGCVNWSTDAQDNGDAVECRLGSYVIPISVCEPLKKAYQTGTGTQTLSAVDPTTGKVGYPGTETNPQPSTQPQPTTGTNPTTVPTPTATASPPVGTVTTPNPPSDPESQDCWGSGWSWNPVSWVYVPVKCALEWAFVPPSASWGLSDLQTAFTTRPPGSIVTGLGSMVASIYGSWNGAGCGKLLDLDTTGIGDGHQVVTCPQIESLPGFSAVYVVLKAGIYGLTAFGLWRMFLAAFGPKGD